MAQSRLVTVTAYKIVRKNQQVVTFASGKSITIDLAQARFVPIPDHLSGVADNDTLFFLPSGDQVFAAIAAGTLAVALSATQETGS